MDIIDVLWAVTLDDVIMRHAGMIVKALTLICAPALAMPHRRITQVPFFLVSCQSWSFDDA
jgi:hypothetical protein